MKKFLKVIIGLAIIGTLAYVYFENFYLPCRKPIAYKIESFDTRFGISRDYFLSALRAAEAVWEKPIGRELFAYEPKGNLNINLIYDYRQQATAKLQKLGLSVSDDRASYDILQAKYKSLEATYALAKMTFDTKVSDYKARQSAYEKAVADWNAHHGATKGEYDRLKADGVALNATAEELNQLQIQLNEEIDNINALVVVLNRLGGTLNLQVSKFNAIGESRGAEFEEGNYQSGPSGERIDIYEFEDRGKLVRVLAHELGHALGLGHVADPNAIMYRLNNGINGKLSATDLAALKKLCGSP